MKPSDWIAGAALFVSGTVIYLTNHKDATPPGKTRARVGLGVMLGGALLSLGHWMINLIASGQ